MQGKFTIVHKILSDFQPFPSRFFPSSGKTSLFPKKFPPRRRFPRPKPPAGAGTPKGPFPDLDFGARAPRGQSFPGGTLSSPGVLEGNIEGRSNARQDFHFQDIPPESPGHGEKVPSHWERTKP